MRRTFRRAMHLLAEHGHDLLFWGCTSGAIANAVCVLTGPEPMRGQFCAMAIAFGSTAGLLYLGEKPEE